RRQRRSPCSQLVRRDKMITQADPVSLGPVDTPAGIEKVKGRLPPYRERQGDGDPKSLVEAELDEIRREPALGRGDAKVSREREPQATADRRPLDRGHDR